MRNALNRILRKFGFELERYETSTSQHKLQQQLILSHKIDLLLDIGANSGQFGEKMRDIGYKGKMVSFEPMRKAFTLLKAKADADKNWDAHNCALGDEEKETEINISENSYSSSLFSIKKELTDSVPATKVIAKEAIKVKRLTDVISLKELSAYRNIMLKIDVQGYEFLVLKGCTPILPHVKLVQTEMAFTVLYESGRLYDEMIAYMKSINFELYSLIPEFYDAATGKLMEADGVFMNKAIKPINA
jgi:FkbM family methyltransferase